MVYVEGKIKYGFNKSKNSKEKSKFISLKEKKRKRIKMLITVWNECLKIVIFVDLYFDDVWKDVFDCWKATILITDTF